MNRFQIEDEIELEMQAKNLPPMVTLSPQSDKYSEKVSSKVGRAETGKSIYAIKDFREDNLAFEQQR